MGARRSDIAGRCRVMTPDGAKAAPWCVDTLVSSQDQGVDR